VLLFAAAAALSALRGWPDMFRRSAAIPQNFKELRGRALKGFKVAAPRESVARGHGGWSTAIPCSIRSSARSKSRIRTVAAAAAAYEQARTLIARRKPRCFRP